MIPMRESPASEPNGQLRELVALDGEGNLGWLARSGERQGILLLGGSSLADFRVRVAQSQLRSDLTPSYWSVCGLLVNDGAAFRTVPLQPGDVSEVPRTNAVRTIPLGEVDDPLAWPNIAVLHFAQSGEVLVRHGDRVADRRTIVDLPELLVVWLSYVWAAGDSENPLLHGKGMPGAAFVEAASAMAGIELTPGLSSAASCPEAIWQGVKWWHEYYAEVERVGGAVEAGPIVPTGVYARRQRAAAVRLPPDAPLFIPGPPESTAAGA